MKKRNLWKCITAAVLLFVLVLSKNVAYAGQEDPFEIKDGVLTGYSNWPAKEVTIPEGVTSIGDKVFSDRYALGKVTIPEGVVSIGMSAFSHCNHLEEVVLPKSLKEIGESVFMDCKNLSIIEIPSGVTSIGESAFSGCESLSSIEIPDGVTSIKEWTFYNCKNLNQMNIPDNVKEIGVRAFSGCDSLKSVVIPKGVEVISSFAFGDCDGLENVTISEGVKQINYGAFDCINLKKITIPESVTYIDISAFWLRKGFTIYGKAGSYAEKYAMAHKIPFVATGEIERKDIKKCQITVSPTSFTYSGKSQNPSVTVKDGEQVLETKTDYAIAYRNNIDPGMAKIIITGQGRYIGSISKTFDIKPKKQTIKKVKEKSGKKLSLVWRKDKGVTGYQIQYSIEKKFRKSKGAATVIVKKNPKTILKNLKKGKRYYIRVRSYKTVKSGGKARTLYGAWSSAKRSKMIK